MKSFFNEFQKFISRGNVIDLAVGVIIGGVFGKIVTSLVEDIIMPPIGLLISGVEFSEIKIILRQAYENSKGVMVPDVSINIGNFLQNTLNFFIVAFCIFMIIKGMNKIKEIQEKKENLEKKEESQKLTRQEELLTEIRDLLKK